MNPTPRNTRPTIQSQNDDAVQLLHDNGGRMEYSAYVEALNAAGLAPVVRRLRSMKHAGSINMTLTATDDGLLHEVSVPNSGTAPANPETGGA